MQLPSFALPSHPYAFALVPNTLAMEDEEALAVAGSWTIAFVQACDSVNCNGEQIIVTRQGFARRSEEHTSELQSRRDLVCRLLLEKKKTNHKAKNTNLSIIK